MIDTMTGLSEQVAHANPDDSLLVRFLMKPKIDKNSTDEQGRPIYVDTEYVDIKIPGSKTGGVCRPARAADRKRFPRHYDAFKQRVEPVLEGTPLAEWPSITRSQVEQLSFMNIRTVEQLADLNDNYAGHIMGGNNMKKRAGEFLVFSKKMAEARDKDELEKENAALRSDIDDLKDKVAALVEATTDTVKTNSHVDEDPCEPDMATTLDKPKRRRRATRKAE